MKIISRKTALFWNDSNMFHSLQNGVQIRYEVRYTGVVSKKSNEKHPEKLVKFLFSHP